MIIDIKFLLDILAFQFYNKASLESIRYNSKNKIFFQNIANEHLFFI